MGNQKSQSTRNAKLGSIGLLSGVAILVVAVIFVSIDSKYETVSEGPQLVDQMKYFFLAKTLLPRPEISWKDANGNDVALADYASKSVLLNFWATWCSPCVRELPSLNRLQKTLGGDKFAVVALNIDLSGKPAAAPMMKRLKLDALELHLDPTQKSSRTLGVRVMPTTYLLDSNGNILGLYRGGAEWDSREAVNPIRYFIERPDHALGLRRIGG